MDIDRNKINEMKSECLQMPDYIRDMIEETVEQQLKKKQRYGKKMWRVAAAILAAWAEEPHWRLQSYTKCIWSSRGNMALH